jgi:hypothetical protein
LQEKKIQKIIINETTEKSLLRYSDFKRVLIRAKL